MPNKSRNDSLILELDPAMVYSVLIGAVAAAAVSQLTWKNVYPIPVSLGMLGGFAFGPKHPSSSSADTVNRPAAEYSNNF